MGEILIMYTFERRFPWQLRGAWVRTRRGHCYEYLKTVEKDLRILRIKQTICWLASERNSQNISLEVFTPCVRTNTKARKLNVVLNFINSRLRVFFRFRSSIFLQLSRARKGSPVTTEHGEMFNFLRSETRIFLAPSPACNLCNAILSIYHDNS